MEDDINDLLIKARDNISDNVDKQTEFNNRKALDESMKHLKTLKTLNEDYTVIRNEAIRNLYGIGYSAIELAEITNLTRQNDPQHSEREVMKKYRVNVVGTKYVTTDTEDKAIEHTQDMLDHIHKSLNMQVFSIAEVREEQ